MRFHNGIAWRRAASSRALALLLASTCLATAALADSATWDGTSDVNWSNQDNWTPPPAGLSPTEVATFDGVTGQSGTVTNVTINQNATIETIQFLAGAPAYTFSLSGTTFEITGTGIVNNSSFRPIFNAGGGLLQFSNNATAGNAIINNTTGAVTFTNSTTGGTAQITTADFGLTSFTDTSTAGAATLITNNNGQTQFASNAMGGTATMIVNDGGLLRFSNMATAENATITVNNNGTVLLQDTATLGNATVTIDNGGTVALGGFATGGDARVIINAGGTFDFTGLFGAATPTAGSIEGAGTICLCNHVFTVGSNNLSTVFSGTIQNGAPLGTPAALVKVGTGMLTLSGSAHTYLGATTVNGGTLLVTGSILNSSGVIVNAGGTIGGTGQLPGVTINGGTLSPGNSIGTITINGNLTFVGAGNYLVEVSPTAADRTYVIGTATLAGTLTLVATGGTYTIGKQYVLLNATGGITGTFTTGSLAGLFGPAIRATVTYDGNNVLLNLDPNAISPFLPQGTTVNQRNVARAIDQIFQAGNAPAPFLSLFNLSQAGLLNALNQLSGEVGTGAALASFESMRRFIGAMLDPWVGTRADNGVRGPALGFAADPALPEAALAFAPMPTKAPHVTFAQRWTAWAAAYGSHGKLPGEGVVIGSHDLDIRTGGVASGFDYRLSPDTVIGLAFAGGTESFGLSGGLGSGRADVLQAGVYGSTRLGDYYLSAAALAARFDVSTERTATLPGVSERLLADFTAHGFAGRLEGGRRFLIGNFRLTPYAAVQAQSVKSGAYAERGAVPGAAFALTYDARTATSTRSELGLTLDGRVATIGGGALSLFARGAWGHELVRDNAINATFQALPGALFTVHGARPWDNAALVSSGFEWRLSERIALKAKLEGEIARAASTYAGTGTIRVTW